MNNSFKRAVKRRSVKLLLYQWIALDYVASSTDSKNITGTRKGNRSWRCLLRRIAEGELIVIRRAENKDSDNQNAKQAAPLPVQKPVASSVKRRPGRPIPDDRPPVPMPPGWQNAA